MLSICFIQIFKWFIEGSLLHRNLQVVRKGSLDSVLACSDRKLRLLCQGRPRALLCRKRRGLGRKMRKMREIQFFLSPRHSNLSFLSEHLTHKPSFLSEQLGDACGGGYFEGFLAVSFADASWPRSHSPHERRKNKSADAICVSPLIESLVS